MAIKLEARESGTLFETLDTLHSQRVETTYLINLRRHVRFDTDMPATAIAENGEVAAVRIANLSRSGLRLDGDQQIAEILDVGTEDVPIFLQVCFSVPSDPDLLIPVNVRCRTVYTRCEAVSYTHLTLPTIA